MNLGTARIYHGGGPGRKSSAYSVACVDTDVKVGVTNADTTPDYLNPKVTGKVAAGTGSNVVTAVLNPGGNEQLEIEAYNNKVANTVNDTTPNYLASKLVAGNNISLVTLNPGANETLQVNNTASVGNLFKSHNLGNPTGLGVGSYIQGVGYGVYPGSRHGYYIGNATYLREVHVLVNRFTTYAISTLSVEIRKILADGTAPASILITTVVVTFPNTGGAFGYYMGASSVGLSIAIPAGYNIYGYISAGTVNSATGITVVNIMENQ